MFRFVLLLSLAFPVVALGQSTQSGSAKPQEGVGSYVNKGLPEGKGGGTDPGNTAASRDLPKGSKATVTNQNTGKTTDVEITGKGPMRQDRQIDVSKKAAKDLGMEKSGTAPVKIEPK